MGMHDEPPSDAERAEDMRRRLAERDDAADAVPSHDSYAHYDPPLASRGGGNLPTGTLSQRAAPPATGGGTADTRAFTLVGAEADSDGGAITVRFSRNVDGVTGGDPGIYLITPTTNGVGGASVQGNIVRIIPSIHLVPGTEYTITVGPTIRAADGTTRLTGSPEATFSIAGFRFVRAFASASRAHVSLEFSDTPTSSPIPAGWAAADRFLLRRWTGTAWVPVSITSDVQVSGPIITISPTSALAAGETYAVTVLFQRTSGTPPNHMTETIDLVSADGLPLAPPLTQTFETDEDLPDTGFRILGVTDRNGRRQLVVTFSEALSTSTVRTRGRFRVDSIAGNVFASNEGGSTVILTLPTALLPNTSYTLRISRGLMTLDGTETLPTDAGADDTTFSFSTGETPPFGVADVRVSTTNQGTTLIVEFTSEPTEASAEAASNWSVSPSGPILGTPEKVGLEVRIPVTGRPAGGVSYTLTISPMVVSADGASLSADDRQHQVILSVSLLNLLAVPSYVSGDVRLVFSRPLAPFDRTDFDILPNTGSRTSFPESSGVGVRAVREERNPVPARPNETYVWLSPSIDLPPGTSWHVTWSRSLMSEEGGSIRTLRSTLTIPGGGRTFEINRNSVGTESGVTVGSDLTIIHVDFTDTVQASTAVPANFTLSAGTSVGGGSTPVPSIQEVSASGRRVTIRLASPLESGARYTWRAGTGLMSASRGAVRGVALSGNRDIGPFTAGRAVLTALSATLEGARIRVSFSHAISASSLTRTRFGITSLRTGITAAAVSGNTLDGTNDVLVSFNPPLVGGTSYRLQVNAGLPSTVRGVRPTEVAYFTVNTPEIDPLGFSSIAYIPARTVEVTFTRDIESNLAGHIQSDTNSIGVSRVVRHPSNTRVARVTLDRDPVAGTTYTLAISENLRSSDRRVTYTGPATVEFTVPATAAGFTVTGTINNARNRVTLTFSGGQLHRNSLRFFESLVRMYHTQARERNRISYTPRPFSPQTVGGVATQEVYLDFPANSREVIVIVQAGVENRARTNVRQTTLRFRP